MGFHSVDRRFSLEYRLVEFSFKQNNIDNRVWAMFYYSAMSPAQETQSSPYTQDGVASPSRGIRDGGYQAKVRTGKML